MNDFVTTRLAPATAALLLAAPLWCGARPEHQDPRDLVARAKIPFAGAIERALAAAPGAAVSAELEHDGEEGDAGIVWEVVVVGDDGALHEISIDAVSGKVLGNEAEDDDEELAEAREVLRHCELTLPQLAQKVAELVRGVPVAAELEFEDGGPICDMQIVNGRYLVELDVEARAGHVLELGLAGRDEHDDEADEDEHGRRRGDEDDDEGEEEEEGEEHEHAAHVRRGREHEEEEAGEEEHERAAPRPEARERRAEASRRGDDDDEDEDEDEAEEHARGAATTAFRAPAPLAAGVKFSPRITHPFLPLSSVRLAELRSSDERVVREVQPQTRVVAGVECLVLAEKEYEGEELAEISHNFFAQDADGNVWYFGEDVDEYEDGKVVGHEGAWLVGRNAKEPCLFMPAELEVGTRFKRENTPPDADEFDAIGAVNARAEVPAGKFDGVLVVFESDRGFGAWSERKYYARGVGLVSENGELNLVSFRKAGD